jgi:hypothetical protein
MGYIPCQNCGKQIPSEWTWMMCDKCGFRICLPCLNNHKGKYGSGYKCSRCVSGQMRRT